MEDHARSHSRSRSHSKSAPKAGNSLSSDEPEKLTPAFDPIDPMRYQAARKSTWVSAIINLLFSVLQIVAGFFGKSQALMADGLHSLSDLLSDVLVLYANRHSSQRADAEHPYGHARIETAATLVLGISLALLGGALLIIAVLRLQQPAQIQAVHPLAFWVALLTLAAKEGLFRYLLSVAKRVRSQMLAANAWHSRSDALSSLVVVVGIGGNLLGYYYLDLVAAAIVGAMILHMGGSFAKTALSELIDTGSVSY
ncbi:MAG: cation diffusion facilitator family transporter, partial [Candidatus Nitrotoga sp.]